ncbi:MAG TPA: RHS repeat-associated core domain-containing protein [Verrucomicrobiota bacterium]|nr:RHS repeat-associated core domain-containing protein [Verrucomicrobiota bacterium]
MTEQTDNSAGKSAAAMMLNQLSSIPDSAPAYDRRGNLVSRVASGNIPWKELYYSYDHENQLTCVQTDTYYTPESYRFKVEFVYDGQSRVRIKRNYIYDPYGRYMAGAGTLLTSNVMWFSSKPWVSFLGTSATSGLYYYGYRLYDPYLQRWLNRDPTGENGGVNLFRYVRNKPVIRLDPDGRFSVPPWARWPGGIGLVVAVLWAGDALWHCDRACVYWMDGTLARARIEANTIAAGDSTHNDEGSRADSLVHCIAACRLARDPGNCGTSQRALDSLQARENRQTLPSMMDTLNNIQGYSIGMAGKNPDACARDCTRELNAGSLLGINPDSGQLEPWPPHEYFPVR